MSSPSWNLSKNTGRYVENTNKKNSFLLWQICQFNHYGWLILLKFYWFLNSNSQNLLLAHFLTRPILDPKFPLMAYNKQHHSWLDFIKFMKILAHKSTSAKRILWLHAFASIHSCINVNFYKPFTTMFQLKAKTMIWEVMMHSSYANAHKCIT